MSSDLKWALWHGKFDTSVAHEIPREEPKQAPAQEAAEEEVRSEVDYGEAPPSEPESDDEEEEKEKGQEEDDDDEAVGSAGQPVSKTVAIVKPCKACGAETDKLIGTCLSCGSSIAEEPPHVSKAKAEILSSLKPRIKVIKRGGRSSAAVESMNFRNYVKRARKLGYDSVTHRF